jgi:hypothetical protein
MSTKTYAKKFTDEQRAAYRQAQREEAEQRLTAAVSSLQSSDGFAAWLRARSRFHTYSLNNTLLILAQLPEASRVASASVWKDLDRHPAKGSRALRIFAPIEWWVPCAEGEQGARWNSKRERWERKVRSFKLVPVFDVSQTEGAELPEPPDPAEVDGDTHGHLEPRLVKLAGELGFSVSTEQLGGDTGGYCDAAAKRIVIADGLAPNARVRVLVHELAHALGIGYADFGRAIAEVLVESVTYIVLAGAGFDLDAASVPYVAGWAGQQDAAVALRSFASKVDEVARRIEAAIY